MSRHRKDELIATRVSPSTKMAFCAKAREMGMNPSELIRELVTALLDGRNIIIPPSK